MSALSVLLLSILIPLLLVLLGIIGVGERLVRTS
jgi:hypothetical protein